jgi:hypothetical protein
MYQITYHSDEPNPEPLIGRGDDYCVVIKATWPFRSAGEGGHGEGPAVVWIHRDLQTCVGFIWRNCFGEKIADVAAWR